MSTAARSAAHRLHALALAVLATAAGVAALAASAPAASAKATSSPAANSTFTTVLDTAVSTFNPFLAFEQGEIDTLDMIYPFMYFNNEQNEPAPYLVRSSTLSTNKLTWTFHLQTGLKWSDGTPLTAKDVAWTLNLIRHNTTAGSANGALETYFKTITAPDASTVVITTTKPLANMTNDLATIPIVPEHIWASKVKGLSSFTNTQTPVVGYGPYLFTGYHPQQDVSLTANPGFKGNTLFGSGARYHHLVLDYFANSSAGVAALRNGSVDSSFQLTDTEWRSLDHTPGIKAYQTLTNDWIAVEVNGDARTRSGQHIGNGNPLLANPAVRRAIALGINRNEIVQKVVGGAGIVTGSYLTQAFPQWYWTPSASQAQNYDPAKANAMLTAAGFPMGKSGYRYDKKTGKQLSFRLGIHNDSSVDAATAPYLVGFMKAIGIKLNVQAMSDTQLNDNLAVGDWDLLMDQWPEGSDPTYLLSIQTCGVLPQNKTGSGGQTDSFFCNKRYDQLYSAEQTEFNLAKREADVKAMEQILYNANYDIILYDHNYLYATRNGYTNGYLYGSPNAKGLYPLQNYELGWVRATPAAATGSGGGGSSTVLIVVIIVVVVVLLGGGGLLAARRRRLTAEERE